MQYSRKHKRAARRTQRRNRRRVSARWARRMYRKNKSMRRRYGGGIEDILDDTISFSNYYQLKHAKETNTYDSLVKTQNRTIFEVPKGSVVWVIDMQNDFIDFAATNEEERPGENLRLDTPNGKLGNFSVNQGINCVQNINKFIDLNINNLSRVVYTRDWHSPGHCSFGIGAPLQGKYPPHCEYNSLGADLNPEIKAKIDRKEDNSYCIQGSNVPVDIIFKGHHSDADSYSAASFEIPDVNPISAYLDKRQNQNGNIPFKNASCCQGDACNGKTGGMQLKDKNIDARKCIIHNTEQEKKDIEALIAKFANPEEIKPEAIIQQDADISKQITEKYFENYIIPKPEGEGLIYVIGLAGEFCVKDTAINLARMPDFKGKVHVIQSLTRYPFLPIFIPLQNYEYETNTFFPYGIWVESVNAPQDNEYFLDKFQSNSPKKSVSLYLFENTGGKYRKLTADEAAKVTDADLKTPFKYWHLSSDTRSMVDDYVKYGVKLIVDGTDRGVKEIIEKKIIENGFDRMQSRY